jgi:uncharacterized protein YbaA (DUF1428 family)
LNCPASSFNLYTSTLSELAVRNTPDRRHYEHPKAFLNSIAPNYEARLGFFVIINLVTIELRKDFKMTKYVDGFVLVVPKGKEAKYEEMARMGKDSWMKHGALQYFECRGDDLKQQEMGDQKSRTFAEMAGASDEENVWFSFIVFESKEHRDEVNKKVMAEMDESFSEQTDFEMPNDMKRMAYGGFTAVVEG